MCPLAFSFLLLFFYIGCILEYRQEGGRAWVDIFLLLHLGVFL